MCPVEDAMIEFIEGFPASVVAIAAKGRVTREDYEGVLIPAVNDVFKRHGKIRLYYEFGTGYSGFDAGAALQDFKVGVEHWKDWERVAVVTDVEWLKQATLAFGFLLPGRMRVFSLAEAAEAREWIAADGREKRSAAA
jgi:hypothetical protein